MELPEILTAPHCHPLQQLGIVEMASDVLRSHCQWRLSLQQQMQHQQGNEAASAVLLGAAEQQHPTPHLLEQHQEELQLRNRVVFHALGALAVLAVDVEARAQWTQVSLLPPAHYP